tara:strand:- start:2252 stop:2881 length:630 start_codon:yes stop_codon:yes gene_type:complete
MNKINLNLTKIKILNLSKKYISENGWNDNLFNLILKKSKLDKAEIQTIFPSGYISLLELYLNELNKKMILESKKINLSKLRISERIKKIILLKFKIYQKEKKIMRRAFFTLMLPQNYQTSLSSLFSTVDQIWFLAGDNSTDFNYYTKRVILAKIYSSTLLYWIKKGDLNDIPVFLEKELKKVSFFPKVKNQLKKMANLIPEAYKTYKSK